MKVINSNKGCQNKIQKLRKLARRRSQIKPVHLLLAVFIFVFIFGGCLKALGQ